MTMSIGENYNDRRIRDLEKRVVELERRVITLAKVIEQLQGKPAAALNRYMGDGET
jgi:hypothetical protein